MIVIAIIGILAAIALPAYSSYMKKAKFTEVMNVAESVKTPISLCIQEHGAEGASKCSNSAAVDGFGWELKVPADYATKYVSTVKVEGADYASASAAIVTITVTPDGTNIESTSTLILKGYWTAAGQLEWKIDSSSGCATAKLCKAN